MTETTSLWALFISSFLAATILPGGSELVLYAVLKSNPDMMGRALAVATLGNTLGGVSSYAIGRLLPLRGEPARGMPAIRRFGAPVLLLSWVPLAGDALCVAAGWFRINPFAATLYMAIGKFGRYLLIALVFE
jgi:membrane protein YqaA with SNARE-associated domain